MDNKKILLDSLSYRYAIGTPNETLALNNISLTINDRERIGFAGETGAGKTTLAQIIAGLIKIKDESLTINFSEKSDSIIRLGYVFQYPEHQLFAETVYDDIAYGLREFGIDEETVKKKLSNITSFLNLKSSYFSRSPFDLSGGEMRKVALAGILILEPEILILDEPTVGLDPESREDFIEKLLAIQEKQGFTLIIVTHDIRLLSLLDRIFILKNGDLKFSGTPLKLFSDNSLLNDVSLIPPLHIELSKRVFNRPIIDYNCFIKDLSRKIKDLKDNA